MLNLVALGGYQVPAGATEGPRDNLRALPHFLGHVGTSQNPTRNLGVRRRGKPPPHCRPLCPSELYSYTEEPEFGTNRRCFEEDFRTQVRGRRWLELDGAQQKAYVMHLLDGLEVVNRDKRLKVARAILYLAQGVFGDCDNDGDVLCNSQACSSALRKPAISLADSTELRYPPSAPCPPCCWHRGVAVGTISGAPVSPCCPGRVLLSVMYLMVENIRVEQESDPPEWKTCRETFRMELGFPVRPEEPFALLLFTMVTKFCSGHAPHFPMKKVLLLLWKVLLFTLGGFEALQAMKVRKREELGLPPLPEDSIQVMRSMRAASPPTYCIELVEQQQQKRGHRSRRPLMKQDSLDIYNERDPFKNDEAGIDEEEGDEVDGGIEGELDLMERDAIVPAMPAQRAPIERVSFPKGLPWAPKVRQKDIEHFLEASRNKFIGFTLGHSPPIRAAFGGRWAPSLTSYEMEATRITSPALYLPSVLPSRDTETLIGLPRPIHESVKTLKQHKYISISDVQIKNEEELEKCPMSLGEEEVQETPCEILYRAMLYNLPQYMIALLKILLAAAPTSKAKTDSINILADVLPEEMPITVLQSMKLGIDVNRHKEIIVKSISALLLLLLKHLKLNHIYQFEYVSQHLVFANCIPLILKFFNQNIMSYITAKNSISVLDYPHCTVHDLPELTAESLEAGDNNQFCWRNLFSCINLLRILNKLTKWKHSRTMMLVVFKSAPILKRALKVKQAMMQLYVLKLLKIQTKYLGRQWRKSNMKTMSAIYQKVRHRMNDDWAYGNDIDARPWDFQAEECTLRANIEAFNSRRYDKPQDSEFAPVDNCLQSVLGQRLELPEDFHCSYELWLEREVFSQPIRWEELLHYQ
ncbi:Striatin-interacting protein 2 [Aix galericulata]|nr:Striatin-interacting protein 2 [Aix galericulata]